MSLRILRKMEIQTELDFEDLSSVPQFLFLLTQEYNSFNLFFCSHPPNFTLDSDFLNYFHTFLSIVTLYLMFQDFNVSLFVHLFSFLDSHGTCAINLMDSSFTFLDDDEDDDDTKCRMKISNWKLKVFTQRESPSSRFFFLIWILVWTTSTSLRACVEFWEGEVDREL